MLKDNFSDFQDVRPVPDDFLLRLHGSVQWGSWDNVWNSWIYWDKCFCAKDLFECENRLEKKIK